MIKIFVRLMDKVKTSADYINQQNEEISEFYENMTFWGSRILYYLLRALSSIEANGNNISQETIEYIYSAHYFCDEAVYRIEEFMHYNQEIRTRQLKDFRRIHPLMVSAESCSNAVNNLIQSFTKNIIPAEYIELLYKCQQNWKRILKINSSTEMIGFLEENKPYVHNIWQREADNEH